jgi:hypothetical protein
MPNKTEKAIKRLDHALSRYDECKRAHKDATDELTDAKKDVDVCARAVVDAEHAAPTLFDEEPAPTKQTATVDGAEATIVSPGGASDADDAGDADAAGEVEEVVLSGTTGGPVERETHTSVSYEMTPSPENPELCVCGWLIAAIIPGHDERHARYAEAIEGESTGPKPTRARSPRKKADITAAVAAAAATRRKRKGRG